MRTASPWKFTKGFILGLLFTALSFAATNVGGEELPALDAESAAQVSYQKDVKPILKRHCWGCHNAAKPQGGLNMVTVSAMNTGGDSGAAIDSGKPDASLLIEMIVGDQPEMPKQQPPLSVAKIHTLRQWILAGAVDDSTGNEGPAIVIPETYRIAPPVVSVAISPDGQRVAAACRSEVLFFEVDSEATPQRLPTESDLITHVEFSPNGKLLAASGGSPSLYGEVRFFNVEDGSLLHARRLGADTFFGGGFSPDSAAIALGGAEGAVHIVPIDEKADARQFDLHSDWVLDVCYTADGKMLVTGGRDKTTKVSDVESGRLLRTIDSSKEIIRAVAADGQYAVSVGKARAMNTFEFKIALEDIQINGFASGSRPISKRAQYAKAFEAPPGEAFDLAVSGDRQHLAVVGAWADARVYTLATRKRTALIAGLPTPIYSAALSHDGKRLAIGAKNGLVQVYDLPEGKLVSSLTPAPMSP